MRVRLTCVLPPGDAADQSSVPHGWCWAATYHEHVHLHYSRHAHTQRSNDTDEIPLWMEAIQCINRSKVSQSKIKVIPCKCSPTLQKVLVLCCRLVYYRHTCNKSTHPIFLHSVLHETQGSTPTEEANFLFTANREHQQHRLRSRKKQTTKQTSPSR